MSPRPVAGPIVNRRFVRAGTASRPTRAGVASIGGYWPKTALLASAMVAILCFRVHEGIPLVHYIHPALITTYAGTALLLSKSSRAALDAALKDKTFRIIAAYAAWMWVTVPMALWPGMAFQTAMLGIPICASVIALLLCPPDRSTLSYLSNAFCIGALLLAAVSLANGATLTDQIGGERLTASGSFDSNDLAATMAISVPIALGIARRERGKRRLLAIALVLLFSVVIIKTGSRGGALALIAAGLVFVLGFGGAKKIGALAGLAVTLAIGFQFAPESFRERMLSLTNVEEDYNYTAYGGRKQIWARGRGYILEHPITGVGAGNFPIAEGDYAARLGRPAKWSAPHNAYVQAFAELGVIGGVIFIFVMLITAQRAWPMWRQTQHSGDWHRPEYLAALAAYAAGGYFLSQAYFYLLFGLCGLVALADRTWALEKSGAGRVPSGLARPAGWRSLRAGRPQVKPTIA